MNKFFLCTLALTVCAMTGCATSRPPTPSVALAGDTRLAPWPCHNALITPTDAAVAHNYHAILIDPVNIPESAAEPALSAEQRIALAARLDAALAKECATFRPFTVYACVALMYFALCFPLSWWSRVLERKLQRVH